MEYNLEEHLDNIYSSFPEAAQRPVIGITANFSNGDASLRDLYYNQVVAAGGVPVLIPPVADKGVIINTLERIDGLLLSGGGDYNPLWCGEEPSQKLHGINATRDLPELLITRLAYNRQIPILGICRGIQTLAMALGGEVAQDINEERRIKNEECRIKNEESPDGGNEERRESLSQENGKNSSFFILHSSFSPFSSFKPIKHSQDADRWETTHSIEIAGGTMLMDIYNNEKMPVNSFHHQAVRSTGKCFRVSAIAPDGVIEAMESSEHKDIMGVQWHPEWLGKDGLKLFQWLVEKAKDFNRAKKLHEKIITVDSHCDTPMFFPQGIHFEQRDKRILVDMHKMTEGRLDAVFMAAYLPQPKPGEKFTDKVAFDVSGPKEYADLIFDKISDIVNGDLGRYISITRSMKSLYNHKNSGRKSIFLGIENGLALEGNIDNISHFARRGVKYITLCHNGDNDICDSARGTHTHGGVSSFGADVICEMNRLGMMVDLSHAAETSFYDALEISSKPIICSHSNCKALCDVPRNLTDDQLRALAAKGGVAQITLYHGFLRRDGEASIIDVLDHLKHAIDIMDVEHVGIGTDFDGDGGVCGFADASEAINFTKHLLRRRYSKSEIRQIWGGNLLRVFEDCQKCHLTNINAYPKS